MKHTRYTWLTVSALLVAVVIAGGMTYSAQAGIGSTLAKVVGKVTGKVAGTTTKTKCLNGTVTSLSKKTVTVRYADAKKKIINKTLRLNSKQYTVAIGRSVKTGTPVKVCSNDNFKNVLGNITSRVPKGLENTGYGEENGGSGGGGGGGGT